MQNFNGAALPLAEGDVLIIASSVPKGGVVYVTPPHQSTAPRPR